MIILLFFLFGGLWLSLEFLLSKEMLFLVSAIIVLGLVIYGVSEAFDWFHFTSLVTGYFHYVIGVKSPSEIMADCRYPSGWFFPAGVTWLLADASIFFGLLATMFGFLATLYGIVDYAIGRLVTPEDNWAIQGRWIRRGLKWLTLGLLAIILTGLFLRGLHWIEFHKVCRMG